MVGIGSCKGDEVDEFQHFGFTFVKAGKVVATLVEEALANVECEVYNKSQDWKITYRFSDL